MQMRPEVQIRSVIKALTDVVLPAIEPDNQMAREQAQLCIGVLGLMQQQLPLQYRFDCDELGRLAELADVLTETSTDGDGLIELASEARALLEASKASPDAILQQILRLRSATGEQVSELYSNGDAEDRKRVSDAVLASSKEQLLRDRALLLPQGWEADPDALPDIRTLLNSEQAG